MTISNSGAFVPWRAMLALNLIGLAWVLPFQSPNFFEPISSFYGEAAAAMLGLAAITCMFGRSTWPAMQLPRSSLVFLGFAALILLHVATGRAVYPQQNLLAILYLIWATMLAALAWRLREIFGLEKVVTTLAWFTLGGTLVSAAIGLGQVWGISTPLRPFMLPPVGGRIFANTGQPNHLATYLCMGIASLTLLYGSGRVRLSIVAAAAVPLLMVLVVTGSRSIWIYLPVLVVLAGLHRALRPSPAASRILWLSLAALAGFLLMQWLFGLLAQALPSVQAIGARMTSEGLQSQIRLRLWHEAWLMFCDAPFLGQGFRQFPWQHFLLNAQLPPPRTDPMVNDNAHNLIMHTMAEFGLAGIAVLAAGIAIWLRDVWRNVFSAPMWWVLSLAAILAIHSMLEYPLWYAYFLGIAAVVLGASESAAVAIGKHTGGRLVLVPVLLLGWMAAFNIYQDYRTLQSLHRIPSKQDAAAQSRNPAAILLELQQQSLFAPFVELALARTILLDREQIGNKVVLNDAVMHFAPASDVVYRQAVLLALDGQDDAARLQWDRAVANYPGDRAGVLKGLGEIALRDPNAAGLAAYAETKGIEEQK